MRYSDLTKDDLKDAILQSVDSSFIDYVGYVPVKQILFVGMGIKEYEYHNVPQNIFNELVSFPSTGSYYSAMIKGNKQYFPEKYIDQLKDEEAFKQKLTISFLSLYLTIFSFAFGLSWPAWIFRLVCISGIIIPWFRKRKNV